MPAIEPQYFPYRWVIGGVSRTVLARHLWNLKKRGNGVAIACIRHALWVGVYPEKCNLS